MNDYLEPQLKNPDEIKKVLKEVPISFKLDDGREVTTLLVYLPSKGGNSCHLEFFKLIKESILANFAFSCSEVEEKLGIKNSKSAEDLFNKAVRKLSKHTAKGELGELILFTLLDVYFNAPKILTKMKTSRRKHVHGADAVHGQFHNGKFTLYLGESKLHKSFGGASSKAIDSMKKAKEDYGEEFDLLDSYMDFKNISDELKSKLLDLINPFSSNDPSEFLHSPCSIGFVKEDLFSSANSEDEFIESYTDLACKYVGDFYSKIETKGLAIEEVSLILIPFSCVDTLVKDFIDYMGIEQ